MKFFFFRLKLTHLGSQAFESRSALRHFYEVSPSLFSPSRAGARNSSLSARKGLGHRGDVDTKDGMKGCEVSL